MEGSFKGFTSSTPPATRRSPQYDGGSNENEVNSDDSGSKINIPNKSSNKPFMSPIKSVATKGSVPRKKILIECSNFNHTHLHKNPNLDSKVSSKKSPSSNYSSDPDYEDQNSSITDSSLKPYDPLTNYLSPRPKFLRYNPNRRREIILHPKNEIRELNHEFDDKRSVSFDTQISVVEDESSICSSQEDSVEVGGDKIEQSEGNNCSDYDEEEEEIEEFEEESDWSLKGAFKFLLVMAALFLSTLHISSMNSPAPFSSVDEAIWGSRDGYLNIQNNLFQRVTTEILDGGNQTGLIEMKMVAEDNMEFIDTSDEIGSNLEVDDQIQVSQIGQNEGLYGDEFEETKEVVGFVQSQRNEAAEKSKSVEDHRIRSPVLENMKYIDRNSEGETVETKDEMSSAEAITKEGTGERDEDDFSSTEVDEIVHEDEEPDSTGVITKQAEIIGVSLVVAFVAFLGFVYRSRKMRTSIVEEKISPLRDVESEKIEENKGFTSPSSLIHSSVAAPKELSCSKSFVRRSNSKKSKTGQSEESSSSSSVSQERGVSLSYGSFTAEKKILKKEKQEGADMVITTPVRRSSRLLNRGVISP